MPVGEDIASTEVKAVTVWHGQSFMGSGVNSGSGIVGRVYDRCG